MMVSVKCYFMMFIAIRFYNTEKKNSSVNLLPVNINAISGEQRQYQKPNYDLRIRMKMLEFREIPLNGNDFDWIQMWITISNEAQTNLILFLILFPPSCQPIQRMLDHRAKLKASIASLIHSTREKKREKKKFTLLKRRWRRYISSEMYLFMNTHVYIFRLMYEPVVKEKLIKYIAHLMTTVDGVRARRWRR